MFMSFAECWDGRRRFALMDDNGVLAFGKLGMNLGPDLGARRRVGIYCGPGPGPRLGLASRLTDCTG